MPASSSAPPLRWWNHAWRLAIALLIGLGALFATVEPTQSQGWQQPSEAKIALDLTLGVVALVLVCFRRRWPLAVALLATAASAFSTLALGAALLATISLATRRRRWEIAIICVASISSSLFFRHWMPGPDDLSYRNTAILAAIIAGAMVAWGLYIGSRRELLHTLEERALRAENENDLRAAKARGDERARIAREMHDVLAHKISQVSMLSGALAYRDNLSPGQVRESAEVIQQRANEALADLRSVLGVLRDPDSGHLLNRPQPTLAALDALVLEAEQAGTTVDLVLGEGLQELPETLSRTAYRAVQEALTNVRKHAVGAVAHVRVTGDPESGLSVEVRNPMGFTRTGVPGAGLGLVGLTERFTQAQGRLRAGRVGHEFVLSGWLPWSA